jgi:RNA 3'-terminal phosphate cyclase (ATP)
MITIDGSLYSGSGSIVRQSVAFSALTGKPIHLVNARAKREKPGLRRQHVRVVEAMCELVNGKARGVFEGSQEMFFYPGLNEGKQTYCWDIESAGSTTMLALAVLPVLAFRPTPTIVEIRGGIFQDFAPSAFHLQYVVLPLLHTMGLEATLQMNRPGYVPRGKGSVSLKVRPLKNGLQPITLKEAGPIGKIWGIALASHLAERQVSQRMAESASKELASSGYVADITLMEDRSAEQPGAAFALFADCAKGIRLGADGAGALGRRSEDIGLAVAKQLLADYLTGATVDRFAADQIIPFAALARGTSRFLIPQMTDHVQSGTWMARLFFGAEAITDNQHLEIQGIGWSTE